MRAGPLAAALLLAVLPAGGLLAAGHPVADHPVADHPVADHPVTAELLVATLDRATGQARAGVLLTMKPGWHVYWVNPGDAGLATSVELQLPPGLQAGGIEWPLPSRFTDPGDIVTFGYHGSTLLASDISFAPGATEPATIGAEVALADSAGKIRVLKIRVLEWLNPDCPFVKRHYKAGTMKKLAEQYAAKGVVWLAVNSTHSMESGKTDQFRQEHQLPYPVLIDRDGSVGHAYGAATTPHLFIIDSAGKLVYQGAIDDDPRGSKDAAVGYVSKALDELLAGRSVSVAVTKPYGCSVKYAK